MEAEAKSSAPRSSKKKLMLAGSICAAGDTILLDLLDERGVEGRYERLLYRNTLVLDEDKG